MATNFVNWTDNQNYVKKFQAWFWKHIFLRFLIKFPAYIITDLTYLYRFWDKKGQMESKGTKSKIPSCTYQTDSI